MEKITKVAIFALTVSLLQATAAFAKPNTNFMLSFGSQEEAAKLDSSLQEARKKSNSKDYEERIESLKKDGVRFLEVTRGDEKNALKFFELAKEYDTQDTYEGALYCTHVEQGDRPSSPWDTPDVYKSETPKVLYRFSNDKGILYELETGEEIDTIVLSGGKRSYSFQCYNGQWITKSTRVMQKEAEEALQKSKENARKKERAEALKKKYPQFLKYFDKEEHAVEAMDSYDIFKEDVKKVIGCTKISYLAEEYGELTRDFDGRGVLIKYKRGGAKDFYYAYDGTGFEPIFVTYCQGREVLIK